MTNGVNVSGGSTNGRIDVKPSGTSGVAASVSGNTKTDVDTVNNAAWFYSELAKKWAISEDIVDNTDYSSKHYAEIAKEKAEDVEENAEIAVQSAESAADNATSAANSADTAEMYATQASTGMLWLELEEENWVLDGSIYKYELENLKAVAGVYEGTWEDKKLINADIEITDDSTFIYCIEPINGYVLCTDAVITPEIDTAITSIIPEGNIEATRDGKAVTISTKTYVHEQGVASDAWRIEHNLNKNPSITIVDSADNVVEGKEIYIDANTVEIRFNGSFKGKAYLN